MIMYRCWMRNPDERPTFADLVNRLELIINPPRPTHGGDTDAPLEQEPIYMNVTSSDSADPLNPVTTNTSVSAAHS